MRRSYPNPWAFPGQKWKNNEKWKNDQKNEKETLKRSVLIEKWKVGLGFNLILLFTDMAGVLPKDRKDS